MPQDTKTLQVSKFTKGLVTDTHPLDVNPDTTSDEDNCDLDRRGFRKRRLGLIVTGGTAVGAYDDWTTAYIKYYPWNSVNNNGKLNFGVIQFGASLTFFNRDISDTSGIFSFAVDLADFAAPGVTDVSTEGLQMASGNGRLFVVGRLIEPFYIEYDPVAQNITTVQITIKIRDLVEQDTTVANDARPATISDGRRYDLLNQGWDSIPPYTYNQHPNLVGSVNNTTQMAIDFYKEGRNIYPPKTKPWWVGKRLGDGDHEYFVPDDTYDMIEGGNTLSALGHYVVEAFNIDRATVSGIGSFEREIITDRPTAVAFYAGRVFYGLKNRVYYSQLVQDDMGVVNKCYQDADPTSENVNNLIATDGGTITVNGAGDAIAFFPIENSLLFFSNENIGIWNIGGSTPGSGFSATEYSVQKVSGIGALSSRTIIDAHGIPVWWVDHGIVTLEPQAVKQGNYIIKALTEDKIKFYYDNSISLLAKQFATGVFDHIKDRMIYLYSDDTNQNDVTNRFVFNKLLIYDSHFECWMRWTIKDRTADGMYLYDAFNTTNVNLVTSEIDVVDAGGDLVVDAGGDQVIINSFSLATTGPAPSDVLYLVSDMTT